jgi:hypothetical protein
VELDVKTVLKLSMVVSPVHHPSINKFTNVVHDIDTQTKSTVVNIASAEEIRSSDDWFSDSPEGKRYG